MITYPNCKINLGLHVVERRPDGYHNLESIFLPIGLCDELEIEPASEFSFTQEGIELDNAPLDNLCVKAYHLLKELYPDQVGPVAMRLKKNIPFGAGLGGGSSDAAFVLRMVSELFRLPVSTEELEALAARIGADCAFFIKNQPAYATGIGNQLESLQLDLSDYQLVLLKPSDYVSTREAYSGIHPHAGKADLREAVMRPIGEWKELIENHFEESVFPLHPRIQKYKEMLYASGALYASMSGSGSSVFGLFAKDAPIPDFEDLVYAGPVK
ncbi:MAG: 4-(cytidine 5'-diphospho)-2-C-methyl-D-erythritol kinase [Bacteroidales bacterium]|nr:4-(cytidine 5'-diphospho)-2-C-methyl-D-erythritol kinase [Bacteroidales bacterium]